ncbi:MAG TPA: hypothetical protein VE996_07035 [Terriglobales bacterium]|nr:hypothetical protein [Terriglobales bacterium]
MASEPQLQPALVPGGLEDFLRLEEKIVGVADALRAAREQRLAAEREAAEIKAKYNELKHEFARAEKEMIALRKERDEIRRRVEKLIGQLDALRAE